MDGEPDVPDCRPSPIQGSYYLSSSSNQTTDKEEAACDPTHFDSLLDESSRRDHVDHFCCTGIPLRSSPAHD